MMENFDLILFIFIFIIVILSFILFKVFFSKKKNKTNKKNKFSSQLKEKEKSNNKIKKKMTELLQDKISTEGIENTTTVNTSTFDIIMPKLKEEPEIIEKLDTYDVLNIIEQKPKKEMNFHKTQKFCPQCGSPNDVLNKFCISCGYNFETQK